MTQNVSSRAHAFLIKPYKSSIAFYRLMFAVTLTLLLSVIIFMVLITKAKDPFISPPFVAIFMFIPSWVAFGCAMMGYINVCPNQSEDKLGVQIAHTSA